MKAFIFSFLVVGVGISSTMWLTGSEKACASDDKYSQCYLECKPAASGDGLDFHNCMNACMGH